jgi:protein-histidine pros-kinase
MPDAAGGSPKPPRVLPSRRVSTLVAAALLFAGVFALRVLFNDPQQPISLLYAIPVALIAVEFGLVWGLAAATLALGLFALWEFTGSHGVDNTPVDYVVRGAVFFVLGGIAGALADRLRRLSAQSTRFWELSSDLLCTAGFDGYFKNLNAAWERTLGWTPQELRAQPFIEFVHPDDRAGTEAEAAGLTSAGHETRNFENRYRCKDGTYRTMLWSAKSIPEEELIYAAARDITERKRADAQCRTVLEAAPEAMLMANRGGEIQWVNSKTAELFGYTREELIGQPVEMLIPARYHARHPGHRGAFFSEPRARSMGAGLQLWGLRKDGREFPVEIGLSALETEDGLLATALIVDVTDRKAAEEAAEAAQAEAERANRAKSEFIARMSHELRTPLNAILGFGQLLSMDEPDERRRRNAEHVIAAGKHLLDLINEILDLSQIESGQLRLSLEPVCVATVVQEVVNLVRPIASERAIVVTAELEDQELWVMADVQRLKQALVNLLSNAVKYNRDGGNVTVRAFRAERVRITVADDGPGIAASNLARLFTPFERLGAEQTTIEGTGLGLALSKRMIEAMGGTVSVESEPGKGAAFTLELDPAEPTRLPATVYDEQPPVGEPAENRDHKVLCIEDNGLNRKLMEQIFQARPGISLLTANDAAAGMLLARRHRPQLVLLDLNLPDAPGEQVLARLKADPATSTTPVVILSADATAGQRKRVTACGAHSYLTKPIDVAELLRVVDEILQESVSRAA